MLLTGQFDCEIVEYSGVVVVVVVVVVVGQSAQSWHWLQVQMSAHPLVAAFFSQKDLHAVCS